MYYLLLLPFHVICRLCTTSRRIYLYPHLLKCLSLELLVICGLVSHLTVHFINSGWKLVSHILATRHVDESHSRMHTPTCHLYSTPIWSLQSSECLCLFSFYFFAQFSRKAAFIFAALSVTYTVPLCDKSNKNF